MTRRYTGGFLSTTEQATDASTANGIFTLSEAEQLTASGNFPTGRWTPQRGLRFRGASSAYLSRAMSLSSPPAAVGGSLSTVYNFTISADTNSYSLQAEALKAGWDGKAAATFNLTIAASVVVGSGSPLSPALDLTGFPTGVAINVTVGAGAYVVGAGGQGGGGTGWPSNGGGGYDGGDAIWASVPVTITNNGTIAGGGGGGGGSEGWAPNGNYGIGGGGGGGGAGRIVGTGGAGAGTSAGGTTGATGSSGTLTTGGAGGGGGYHSGYTAGAGGAGGNLGAAGSAGAGSAANWNGSNYAPGGGGAAGYYARGNTHITWSTAGTRLGQVQTAVPTTISMTTFTYSAWVKRGSMTLADDQWLFGSGNFLTGTITAPIFEVQFKGASSGVADRLNVAIENAAGAQCVLQSTAVYRDTAAWYHVVVAVDTNQSVASERVKMYVNGDRITSFATSTYPSQGIGCLFSTETIGSMLLDGSPQRYLDGYMAEPHLVDGLQLPASSFGMTDPVTGTWVPKQYNTIGPKGFYLDFADASSVSNLCLDRSGSANNFTGNNVSVTPGVTYDATVDVPGVATVIGGTDIGGVQRGNYCTLNPLQVGSYVTLQNGNLRVAGNTATNSAFATGTFKVTSGKWYWEVTQGTTSTEMIGILSKEFTGQTMLNGETGSVATFGHATRFNGYINGISGETVSSTGITWTAGDVIGIAVDVDNGAMYLSKNGVWILSGNPLSGSGKIGAFAYWTPSSDRVITPYVGAYNAGYADANFGQRPFTSTPPAGFKTLNTTNLPNPVIKRPSEHFDVKTYVGNGNIISIGSNQNQTESVVVPQSFRTKDYGNMVRTIAAQGNRQKWTWSAWVKRSKLGARQVLFGSQTSTGTADNTTNTFLEFGSDNKLALDGHDLLWRQSNLTFTDTTKWNHITVSVDTTQSTASNRIRIYWNGVEINSWATYNNPSQNATLGINQIGKQWIGAMDASMQFDGGLSLINFVEGQQLAPTSFGSFDAFNNWVPQRYAGTYGTNGYSLDMSRPGIGNKSYALALNGSTNRVTIPSSANLAFGTGDFTIEFNQMFGSFGVSNGSGFAVFYEGRPISTQGAYPCIYTMGSAQTLIWFVNGSDRITSPRLSTGVFYHIAISRVSGTTRMFIDGNLVGSWADTTNYLQAPVVFGNGYGGTGAFLAPADGHTSNLRVVKGTGLYTTNFTAPTDELTAVSGTQLLTFKSSALTDFSSNNFTITPAGGANMIITYPYQQKPICAANFNGAEVYTVTTGSGAFAFGTGDFTIEAWIYLRSYSVDVRSFFESGLNFDTYTQANCNVNTDGTVNLSGTGPSTTNTVQLNCWNHVAYSRTAGVQKIFINGIEGASWSNTTNYTSNGCKIGVRNNTATNYGFWDGYISDLRVVKGTGVYTSNFVPPTTKLTAVTGTQLLALQDAVPVDKSSNGFTLVASGSSYPVVDSRVMRPNSEMFGYDSSGNNNHFGGVFNMMHNFLTMNATSDAPSNSDVGGVTDTGRVVRGNYAVVDKNRSHSYTTVGYGGQYIVGTNDTNAYFQGSPSTLSVSSGKWYAEYFINSFASSGNSLQFGVSSYDWMSVGASANQNGYAVGSTIINIDSATAASRDIAVDGNLTTLAGGGSGISWDLYDCVGVALDADAKKVYFYKNGVLLNSVGANVTVLQNNNIWFYGFTRYYGSASSYAVNFGDTPFRFAPPAGYRSLNTKNLEDFGLNNLPDNYGNFVNTPDLIWIKNRSAVANGVIYDTIRGPQTDLRTSSTAVSTTYLGYGVQNFKPNGFDIAGNGDVTNVAGNNYVAWNWNRGKTPGLDIVSWAGTGAVQAIPHNLGTVPKFIITKSLSDTTYGWSVYHASVGSGYNMMLNTTAAQNAGANIWNNTAPTSTTFTVGTDAYANMSGKGFIAYLWAEVPGFSKFGSYTANGSADGPFIHCGFKPRWVIMKRFDAGSVENWLVIDTARDSANLGTGQTYLLASSTNAEGTGTAIADIVSNGFKLRSTATNAGTSATYIYAAFAETPFKYANAR